MEPMPQGNERNCRIIAELASDYVFQLDVSKDGKLSLDFVSGNFYRITGRGEREAKTMELWSGLIDPGDLDRFLGCLRELTACPRSMELECRSKVRGPKPMWISIIARSLWDERESRIVAIVGAVKDITERKRTEEDLLRSQTLLRSSIESIKGAFISSIDKEYNYLYFNNAHKKRMKDVYGSDIEVGKNLMDCIPIPEDREMVKGRYGRALRGDYVTIVDSYRDEATTYESSFNPIRDAGDEVIGATGFAIDITDRVNAEKEKRKSAEYLQQVQRLESLGILAGGIAHDFNNLLTGIFGFIDLARSQTTEPAITAPLSQAIETMERAKGLTRQLLTFAKGGAPVRKPASISTLVKEMAAFASSGSNVQCEYDLPDDLWHCAMDGNQIGQVIQNLMINAIQAMPLGGTIQIAARNVSLTENEHPTLKKGDYVSLSFRDQGTGIPKDVLPRIFDPFFTTKEKGHGLGLAICHSIVTRHDGAIGASSQPGKGAVFHIHLPACRPAHLEPPKPSRVPHSGSGRFLVMDDEEPVRNVLAAMLQSFGYSVVCWKNGKEAMESFRRETGKGDPIAGMILDLTIPGGMGGKEVAEEIRRTDRDVLLFVASGYAEDPIMARPNDYGFTASIAKPFNRAELTELLETHMGRKGPPSEAESGSACPGQRAPSTNRSDPV